MKKFNIIDVLIIAIVITAISVFGYKYLGNAMQHLRSEKLIIEIYTESEPDFAVKAVSKGDIVKDFKAGSTFGNITQIEAAPSVYYAADDNGQMKKSAKPDYSSARIKVESAGYFNENKNDNGVTIGNTDYFIGKSITYKAGNSILEGKISDIKKLK